MTDLEWATREFERVWPFLEPAVERTGGAYDKACVWKAIESQKAQLWPGIKSAVVTEVISYPTGLKSLTQWLAGGDLDELIKIEKVLEKFARKQGCVRVEIIGRKGWKRALDGYRETGIVLAKDLK